MFFSQLIHDQAAATLAGMEALVAYLTNPNPTSAKILAKMEKEADEYRRILIYELNKTFITPFERRKG
jgi:hypothetical protein